MPPSIFEKMYDHILTDKGLEIFDKDWKEVLQAQAKPRWNPETMWTGA